MKFYTELERVLEAKTPESKKGLFSTFYQHFQDGNLCFERFKPQEFIHPSYHEICTIVPPQDVPKRKNLTSKEGQITLLHAIAHIEYSAIDLALDAAYRFRDLPLEYYSDWLEVADDEIRHFTMIERLLEELGASYGDVAVHNALFEASQKTQHALLERMAVVPRYLEANGLDATPMILNKLQKLPSNTMLQKIISSLEIILDEEINHVKKGDIWFQYACAQSQKDCNIYFKIIENYYPRGFLRPNNLNIQARKTAGFSCDELKIIANKEVC